MKVQFNNKEYKKNGRNGAALKNLCFDIFKQYLSKHTNLIYLDIQNIFNKWHCNNHYVVLSQEDWEQKTENLKNRYFEPINYNEEKLYFTTQWGNNGGECDNINHMINFAQEQDYNIAILENIDITINNEENTSLFRTKNIILYGSPGVGKTHNTNKLISLIEEGKNDREIFEAIKKNEKSDSVDISDIKERVKFVTFHQSFGYEDFIEGFRPNEEGNIELVDGIFKNICEDAQINFIHSIKYKSTLEYDEKQEKLFELFVDDIENEIDKNEKYYINNTVYITNVEGDAFRYQGTNWKNSQRMKFDDIKLIWRHHGFSRKSIKNIPNISGLAKQHATYFAYLATKLLEFSETQNIKIGEIKNTKLKNYYLIIDEINRGNISKIFGELITLIEEDKRDNLEVTLPYSKQPFKIPSNLYIIGTMNSTDKSIALIDIALRRRFTFLKMEPNAELIIFSKAKEIFIALNEQITKDLGEDYKIGHSYFMKIIDEDELKFVLDYKIIPLLEEYYYGDDRLGEIVKKFEK